MSYCFRRFGSEGELPSILKLEGFSLKAVASRVFTD